MRDGLLWITPHDKMRDDLASTPGEEVAEPEDVEPEDAETPARRKPARRDACGFLICQGRCKQPSPYAEPKADGTFVCKGCEIEAQAFG